MTPRSQSTNSAPARAASTSSSNLRAVSHPVRPLPQNDHAPVETAAQRAQRLEAELAQAQEDARAEAEAERKAAVARAAGMTPEQWDRVESLVAEKVAEHERQMAKRLESLFPVRVDLVEEDVDDLGSTETYEGADMQRRLDAILDLADKLGVITTGTVTKHIRGKDGREWKGTPVRNQLEKLFRQRKLVKRGWFPPQGSTSGSKSVGKAMNLYARTEAQLDRYIAEQNALATKKRGN